MEELDIAAITQRSIHGVFAFVTRTFFIQLITFGVNLLLPAFLSPAVFGVYFLVTAVIAFLQYFSDIGLAAALVQKRENITDKDLRTTFTIQQTLVIIVVVIALLLADHVGHFYHLDIRGVFLFDALVIAFFLSSLKTIPSIILERNLKFEKLVIPQIVETLFFNVTVLVLAIKGFGITSFTYAVLLRGVSGLIAMYVLAPWKIRFGIDKSVAKRLLSFGIPFQMNSFLALIKDDLLIAYIGRVLPLAQVGYIGFAKKFAETPLRLIMDNVIRITFPSFSRLQHEKRALTIAVEKSLFTTAFLIFPALTGLVILAPYFIHFIPRYNRWEPVLFSLTLFAINAALSSVSTPLINALNAIGKIKLTLNFMIFWTVITWVLTPLFITWYGFNGFAAASVLISMSIVIVVWYTWKFIPFSLISSILYPLIASAGMGIVVYFLSQMIVSNMFMLILTVLIGALVYFSLIFIIARRQITTDVVSVVGHLKK